MLVSFSDGKSQVTRLQPVWRLVLGPGLTLRESVLVSTALLLESEMVWQRVCFQVSVKEMDSLWLCWSFWHDGLIRLHCGLPFQEYFPYSSILCLRSFRWPVCHA